MKNTTKILIGVVVVALVGAGVYFGNTGLQKGSFKKIDPNVRITNLLPDFTIKDIFTKLDNGTLAWWVVVKNKGACFKDSKDSSKKVEIRLFEQNGNGPVTAVKPTSSDPGDDSGYTWAESMCNDDISFVTFDFDNSNPTQVWATIDDKKEIL